MSIQAVVNGVRKLVRGRVPRGLVWNAVAVGVAGVAFPALGQATLIHSYPFNSDVTDTVGSANGTLVGGATVLDGYLSLQAAQQQYVQFAENLVPQSGSISVSLLARAQTLPDNHFELISQGHSGGCGFYIGGDPSHNIRVGDPWYITEEPYPSDGEWHHFVVTVNEAESMTRLYIDGTLLRERAGDFCRNSATFTRLGKQFEPYAEYFNGAIDDVNIYTGVLTPAEIAGLTFCALHLIPQQPVGRTVCASGSATLSITDFGSDDFTYQWRRDTTPINAGANPSAATPTLTLTNIQSFDEGLYDCVVTNACLSIASEGAQLIVCASDYDCDGTPDFFDYDAFVVAFETGDTRADFDGDGSIDFFDYDAFVVAFEAGC
ncbi:MAG: LamG-like jellyroll fold domain-containing protein [Planctomycetota bacterium]